MNEVLVQVVGVAQRLNFETGELENFVSIRFLDQVHELSITLKEFELLFNARMEREQKKPEASSLRDFMGTPGEVEAAAEVQPTYDPSDLVLHWPTLPEKVLSSQLKRALQMLNVPPDVPASELRELVANVQAEFTEGDWAEVNKSFDRQHEGKPEVAPAVLTAPPAPPQPALGQVTWSDGSPVMPIVKPARTVPTDDYGYPVTGGGVDPSSVVGNGDDIDEDGVGQL
ncbi:MAG: hypothetical protein WC372_08125 [Candidatus Neomarinimicrobiota bacterium]|jgi:hypothetical protein